MKRFHLLAGLILFLTMCLVVLGGFVHNTGSSLACPDWPLCFGQIMPDMVGAVAIEHSHRMLATLVGLLTIFLLLTAIPLRTQFPKLFKGASVALALVIFQGVLGGVTVLLRLSPLVSTAHLATSQIFTGLILYLYIRSRSRSESSRLDKATQGAATILKGLKVAAIFVFIQMCLGAFIRHGGQAVACGLGAESAWLCVDGINEGAVFWPATIEAKTHMMHRIMGVATLLALVFGTLPLLRWARAQSMKTLRILVISGHALVLIQIVLGILTVSSGISNLVVTLHLFVGMLVWLNILTQNLLAREALTISKMSKQREATTKT